MEQQQLQGSNENVRDVGLNLQQAVDSEVLCQVEFLPWSRRKPLSILNIHISQLDKNNLLHRAGCKDGADLCLSGVHIHALFPAASSQLPMPSLRCRAPAVPSPAATRAKPRGANREGRGMEEEGEEEEGQVKQHSR